MKYANIKCKSSRHIGSRLLIIIGVLLAMTSAQGVAAPETTLDQTRLTVLAESIEKGQAYIRSEELANWIIEDTNDYMLIDIRAVEDYSESHIQGAVHIALPGLLQATEIANLPNDRIIVLYANNSLKATQAATVLQLAGKNAYALLGGYEHWVMRTLNPSAPTDEDPNLEQLDESKRAAIAHALKNCDTPLATSAKGYTPPLLPANDQPDAPIQSSGGGVLLDEGC
ncbi:MAG: rhodanese-like domain-containing protein [Gammaproteobacteria bacterium]|nr:rhodanese-like domain-containing protein [Gammaproteobacteria bacterium]